jgi:peptidoglycan endopeptidase LytE
LDYAKTFIGTPYRSGGSSPKGFDCSGYTSYVYKNFGIDLPRTAADQYNYGQVVSAAEAKPGDLVAFKSGGSISHVGIYMGGGKFIHSSSSRGIMISEVYDSYWGKKVLGFSRVM